MTYSRSSTVISSLIELQKHGNKFEVLVSESRPGYEGRTSRKDLHLEDINTTLMTDVAAISMLKSVDYFIIGCDRITSSDFVNKIGTHAFLLIAHHYNIPCLLLADSSKRVNEWPWDTDIKIHNTSEVWGENIKGIHVVNPFYEKIPLKLVSLITND